MLLISGAGTENHGPKLCEQFASLANFVMGELTILSAVLEGLTFNQGN
jgi:hypothetical protein